MTQRCTPKVYPAQLYCQISGYQEKIFPFFDGFIIHLTEDQSNNLETQEILNKIFSDVSGEHKRTILIIKHQ